jgi:hypothetical protein
MKKSLTGFYVLPGVLLGYVKYLWKAIIDHSEAKKDLEALALLQETNNDDFAHRLNSKQIVSWNDSFIGSNTGFKSGR